MKTKEIITKTYNNEGSLVGTEIVEQYFYVSQEEKQSHKSFMESHGFRDSGQVQENVGTVTNPDYRWFGSYYKIEFVNQ